MESKSSIDHIRKFIGSKQDLYEAAIRNGFFLPAIKSKAITEDYILSVIDGKNWCPNYKDIRLLPCPNPPSIETLFAKVKDAAVKLSKNLGLDERHTPDKRWLISILSTYSHKDEIFGKDYRPESKQAQQKMYKTIEIPPHFLQGLPLSRTKSKSMRLQVMTQGKSMLKYMRLKDSRSKIEKQLQLEKDSMENRKSKRLNRSANAQTAESSTINNGSADSTRAERQLSPSKRQVK